MIHSMYPDGRSHIDLLEPADPAAGANASQSLRLDEYGRISAVSVRLVTDATAVNRRMQLYVQGILNIFCRVNSLVIQSASTTWDYYFHTAHQHITTVVNNSTTAAFPNELWLPPSFTIGTDVENLQAGDQVTQFRVFFERFRGT